MHRLLVPGRIVPTVATNPEAFWEWKLGNRHNSKENWLVINRKVTTKIFVNSVGSKAPLSDRLQDRKSLTPNMKIPSYSID